MARSFRDRSIRPASSSRWQDKEKLRGKSGIEYNVAVDVGALTGVLAFDGQMESNGHEGALDVKGVV